MLPEDYPLDLAIILLLLLTVIVETRMPNLKEKKFGSEERLEKYLYILEVVLLHIHWHLGQKN
jgi:hypothetical protein